MRLGRELMFWLAALGLFLLLVAMLAGALLPFALGAAIAYFLNPAVDRIQAAGIERALASALIIGLITILIIGSVFLLLPLVIGQIQAFAQSLPGDLLKLEAAADTWAERRLGASYPGFKAGLQRALTELAQSSSGMLAATAQGLWSRGMALVNLVSLLLVTPIVAFYLLRDWPALVARIASWLPRDHAATIRMLAGQIDDAVSAFVRGQGTICLLLGAIYAAALSVAGLRYGLVIGLATGLLAFLPLVGWVAGLSMALMVALAQNWPDPMLAIQVAIIFAGGMALDSVVLSPAIVGQKIGLHPVSLMLALFVFSALFGLLGVIVAVPVAAALAVLIRFARDRYLASEIYLGHEPRPGDPAAVVPAITTDGGRA